MAETNGSQRMPWSSCGIPHRTSWNPSEHWTQSSLAFRVDGLVLGVDASWCPLAVSLRVRLSGLRSRIGCVAPRRALRTLVTLRAHLDSFHGFAAI